MTNRPARQNPRGTNERRTKATDVRDKNRLMREAWMTGRDLVERLGMRADYGAMRELAGGNASVAEKYRKLRSMANRISEKELDSICALCVVQEYAWGPSFLVELSRLSRVKDRRRIAQQALKERWSLKQFQRHVREVIGPLREDRRVGRKRKVNWSEETEVLRELESLARSWERFRAELTEDASAVEGRAGIAVLSGRVRKEFEQVAERMARLHDRVVRRLNELSLP